MTTAIAGIALFAIAAAILLMLPQWTRPEIYFGVTVPAAFRESSEGRSALRRYRIETALHLAVAFALCASLFRMPPAALAAGAVYLMAGVFHAFHHARGEVQRHAVAPTASSPATLPGGPEVGWPGGWIAAAAPLIALGLAARAAALAPGAWLRPALLLILLLGVIYGAVRHSRRIASEPVAARAERRFRRAVLGLGMAASWLVTLVFAATWLRPGWVVRVAIAGDAVMLLCVVRLIRMGQGGSRLAPASATVIGDGTEDRYWKAGLFYCNPNDPAIFVEKRFGIGYTLNFGRLWSKKAAREGASPPDVDRRSGKNP